MAYFVKLQNVNFLSHEWLDNRGRHYRVATYSECPQIGECHFLVQPNEDPFCVLGGEEFLVIGCSDSEEEP